MAGGIDDEASAEALRSFLARNRSPAVVPASAPPAAPKVDPTYAWCLALLPLGALVATALAPPVIAGYVWIATLVVSIVFAVLDEKRLAAAGVNVSVGWAILLIPVYLIKRTRALHSTPAIPVVWFVTFVLSLLVTLSLPQSYSFSGDQVAASLEHDIRAQFGGGPVTVTCPDFSGKAGEYATCSVEQGSTSAHVIVTIARDGRYNWVLSG